MLALGDLYYIFSWMRSCYKIPFYFILEPLVEVDVQHRARSRFGDYRKEYIYIWVAGTIYSKSRIQIRYNYPKAVYGGRRTTVPVCPVLPMHSYEVKRTSACKDMAYAMKNLCQRS